jgi:hypothetical protein
MIFKFCFCIELFFSIRIETFMEILESWLLLKFVVQFSNYDSSNFINIDTILLIIESWLIVNIDTIFKLGFQ